MNISYLKIIEMKEEVRLIQI